MGAGTFQIQLPNSATHPSTVTTLPPSRTLFQHGNSHTCTCNTKSAYPEFSNNQVLCVTLWNGETLPKSVYDNISRLLTKPGRFQGSDPSYPENGALWLTERASMATDDVIVYLLAKLRHRQSDKERFQWCGTRDFVLAMASSGSPDGKVGDEYRLGLLVHPTSLTKR